MISEWVFLDLEKAVKYPADYDSGEGRKKLQGAYKLMIGEVHMSMFNEPVQSHIDFRKRLNEMSERTPQLEAVLGMLKNEEMLMSKDYRDHNLDIDTFASCYIGNFLGTLSP
ncbi:hypothetical protein SR882_08430 [Guyparkeria halophila]|uniref:Uncharacterized protein n=1 Tax=Guyparkeria halophila TaxID=47960 RepID=A0ABZ0YVJ8_9GAMM|nr:hypothetical protein [Guyparkeria halophila]WQH15783.1 hypothetical protein SR882_08430 [Guyparkeria halophila]